MIKIIAQ